MSGSYYAVQERLRSHFTSDWRFTRFGAVLVESDERKGADTTGQMLSVSEYSGVVPRDDSLGQKASADVSHYRLVRPGQLAVNLMWLNRGGLGISQHLGYISPAYKAYSVSTEMNPEFIHYLLRSSPYIEAFQTLGTGVRPNSQMVDSVNLQGLPIPLPPLPTQRAIADYLDRETAQIDAMAAELDELTERLRNRKEQTVDDLLLGMHLPRESDDAARPLRRGTDWLPSLPDTWTIQPAWCLFGERKTRASLEEVHLTPSQQFGVLPQDEYIEKSGARVVLNLKGGDSMKQVYPGDFVIHLRSFQGGLEQSEYRGKVSVAYTVLTPRETVAGSYYKHLLKSPRFINALSSLTDQLRDGQVISYSRFSLLSLPCPPLEDQRQIGRMATDLSVEVDSMIADAQELKALLDERRSALITEVVTGRKEVPAA